MFDLPYPVRMVLRVLDAVWVPVCQDVVPATSLYVPGLVSLAGLYENSESMRVSDTSPLTDMACWNWVDRLMPPSSCLRRPPIVDVVSVQSP